MTKLELIQIMESVPNDAQVDVYDLSNFTHPSFKISVEKYFDYDNGMPIITIEINSQQKMVNTK